MIAWNCSVEPSRKIGDNDWHMCLPFYSILARSIPSRKRITTVLATPKQQHHESRCSQSSDRIFKDEVDFWQNGFLSLVDVLFCICWFSSTKKYHYGSNRIKICHWIGRNRHKTQYLGWTMGKCSAAYYHDKFIVFRSTFGPSQNHLEKYCKVGVNQRFLWCESPLD